MQDWLEEKDRLPHEIQGSPEWHAYRKHHIGASDVPALMGTCDFRTAHDVFTEKLGIQPPKDISGEFHIIRGHTLEVVALARFEQEFSCRLTKPVRNYLPWPTLHASFDGMWGDIPVETKAPAFYKHSQALCGLVPDTYVDQVQAQIIVAESSHAYFLSFHDGMPEELQFAVVKVYRDENRCKQILDRCARFWSLIEGGVWNDEW
jgi:putative phage-type endonuclease